MDLRNSCVHLTFGFVTHGVSTRPKETRGEEAQDGIEHYHELRQCCHEKSQD